MVDLRTQGFTVRTLFVKHFTVKDVTTSMQDPTCWIPQACALSHYTHYSHYTHCTQYTCYTCYTHHTHYTHDTYYTHYCLLHLADLYYTHYTCFTSPIFDPSRSSGSKSEDDRLRRAGVLVLALELSSTRAAVITCSQFRR